jgi:hypothetical protein
MPFHRSSLAFVLAALFLTACGDKADDVADEAKDRVEAEFRPAPESKACGAEGSFVSTLVPESWIGFCGTSRTNARFTSSCEAHDACYDTLGADRAACDLGFRKNLEKECNTVYLKDDCSASRRLCLDVAKEYYTKTSAKGENAFNKAQADARAKAAITPTPTPAP